MFRGMPKLSLSALVSNTLNRQITNVRIVSLAAALIDWRSPALQSTQYNQQGSNREFLVLARWGIFRLRKLGILSSSKKLWVHDNSFLYCVCHYCDKLGKCCIQILDCKYYTLKVLLIEFYLLWSLWVSMWPIWWEWCWYCTDDMMLCLWL